MYICYMRTEYRTTIATLLFAILCFAGCNNQKNNKKEQTKVQATKYTKIRSNKTIHDFGAMKEGEILAYTFYIENTGNINLIINNIETSCGCTIVKWKKRPIKPGKKRKIEVEFNSSGRYGKQYKVISIFANVPNKVYELIITAEVN